MRAFTILLTVATGLLLSTAVSAQSSKQVERDGKQRRPQAKSNVPTNPRVARARRGARRTKSKPADFFKRLDRNLDGSVTVDEIPERLRQRLGQIDSDGNGIVSKKEFANSARRRGRDNSPRAGRASRQGIPTKRSAEMILRRLDKDADDRLSEQEVPVKMRERFAIIDTSGDGFLDAAEIVSLAERMKNKGKQGRYQSDPQKTRGQMPKRPPRGEGKSPAATV